MKTLIFISKKENNLLAKKGELIININNHPVLKEFNEKNEFEIESEILQWFQKWALKKRFNGKNIKELTVIKKVCYWHFLERLVFPDFGLLEKVHSIHNILYKINLAEYILLKYKPKEVLLIKASTDPLFEIVRRTCKKKGIPIKTISKDNSAVIKDRWKHKASKIAVLEALKARISFRKFIGFLKKKDKRNRNILFVSSDRFIGKTNFENKSFGPICELLEKNVIPYDMLEYDMPYIRTNILKIINRYLIDKENNGRKNAFIGDFYNRKVIKNIREDHHTLKLLWEKLKENKKFRESFKYKNIMFFDLIFPRLDFCFQTVTYYIADIVSTTREVLAKLKPKLIIGNTEADSYIKAMICHTKNTKTNVVSLQHAGISTKKTGMKHLPERDYNKITSFPIPTIKCVRGPYYKKILMESANYPEKRVVVVGDVISDRLINIKKSFNKEKDVFFEKNRLDKGKKIVTIVTGLVPWQETFIREVLKVLKKVRGIQVVVKLHPLDQSNLVKDLAKKTGINAIISNSIDLHKLFCASDLIISYPSSALLEAMILKTPVIMVDLGRELYSEFLGISEVVPVARHKEEIRKYIRIMLKDKFYERKFYNKRKAFLYNNNYKIDGKASERVLSVIKKFL